MRYITFCSLNAFDGNGLRFRRSTSTRIANAFAGYVVEPSHDIDRALQQIRPKLIEAVQVTGSTFTSRLSAVCGIPMVTQTVG